MEFDLRNLLGQLGAALGVDVHNDDVRSGACQALDNSHAYLGGTSGHQNNAILQYFHCTLDFPML
ncbi:hypothetical protein GCM10010038_27400 [Glutamicibacter protophormiae]|nr:hypothetical protein GCM10010038_27400 [Glutamicibacter protophormiae]